MARPAMLVALGFLLAPLPMLQAANVGSPRTQGRGKTAITVEGAYISDAQLQFENATRPSSAASYEPKNFKIVNGYQVAGKISYGVCKLLDAYIKLGMSGSSVDGDVFAGGARIVTENLTANNAFLYGGGLKLAFEPRKDWIIGGDAQYSASDHTLGFKATNATSGAVSNATYRSCVIQEWHIAPYLARKLAAFTPYAGIKYSDLRLEQKNPDDPNRWDHVKFKAADNIGLFVGTDYEVGKHFRLNIEGDFLDELAMAAGVSYQF